MQEAATPDASRWSSLDSRPRFSAVSRGRQTNTDATGTLRPQGTALTRSVRERQHVRGSHMAPRSSLLLHCTAAPWPPRGSMALFPSLSHQSYIIDSEGRVMFHKVKRINGFQRTSPRRSDLPRISKWWPQVAEAFKYRPARR